MAIRGIIFDKDGTLYDFEATWGVWAAELLAGLFGPQAAERGAALGFDLGSRRFAPTSPVIAETTTFVARLLLPHLPDWDEPRLVAHMKALGRRVPLVQPVPLRPLIAALSAAHVLAVATNDDEASARDQLRRTGIDGHFRLVYGYDSGHGGKPAPGQILAFLAETGLPPQDVAMIGDSLHDLHAGRAAGVRTVAVLTGPARAETLEPHADAVLPHIGHLPGWLATAG